VGEGVKRIYTGMECWISTSRWVFEVPRNTLVDINFPLLSPGSRDAMYTILLLTSETLHRVAIYDFAGLKVWEISEVSEVSIFRPWMRASINLSRNPRHWYWGHMDGGNFRSPFMFKRM
jgi:hypothetical protein